MPRKAVCEAPGKVIVSGEHFVVHGATAVAAAIGRGVRVEATRSRTLEVRSNVKRREALAPVKRVLESLYRSRESEPRISISVASALAEGAGLGSSAATMVAAAGAASELEGWRLDPLALAEAGAAGERLVHGNPSGIDATASALGGVILFTRGKRPQTVTLRRPVSLLVAFSGRKRNTGRLVAKVSEMKAGYPSLFAGLCKSATLVSTLCSRSLADGDAETLGSLMTYNHAVLARAGASNPGLDRLVELCLGSGCLGAKLTGAGGGGSVLAVPPPGRAEAEAVARRLSKAGFRSFLTSVPAQGARSWSE